MILQPQEYFTVVRQIGDPTDSNTYYVRAVIRNARTDALIETINLTDRGSRRFSLPWQVPADPSGQGFYISVLTTVYTDSGYTTKSDVYSEEMETYLIDNRFRNLGGGGGGDDVSYKKIREIFEETIQKFFFTEKGVFKFLPDLAPISRALSSLGLSKLSEWMSKTTNKMDVISVKSDVLREQIGTIEIPEYKETDLSPVLQAIKDIEIPDQVDIETIARSFEKIVSNEMTKIVDMFPELSTKAKEIEGQLKDFLYLITTKKPEEKPPAPAPIPIPPDYLKVSKNMLKIHEE